MMRVRSLARRLLLVVSLLVVPLAGGARLASAQVTCREACADEIDSCVASGWATSYGCTAFADAICRLYGTSVCLPPVEDEAGRVRFFKIANSSFDRYTSSPSAAAQQWMRDHYWRMLTYAPYFDARLRWYPDAWVYKDLYALYPNAAGQHPEWLLRDAAGTPLYIPYGCGGGTCPQYAGDVGNPAFRAAWIAQARTTMAKGYRGLFVDDLNLRMQVGDGTGRLVAPWDPRRSAPMTTADWRNYVATFAEEIRAAFPDVEIVHNQVWFFAPVTDPAAERAIAAADAINVERGFNDGGIRGGSGQFGFETFCAYLDALHARGKGVVLESGSTSGRDYALATYFLVSTERDALSHGAQSVPDNWWPGWDVSLGAPAGPRYAWNGLVRRDFADGFVLVNQPDRPTVTVNLGGTWRGVDGQSLSSVTLGPAAGVVLVAP